MKFDDNVKKLLEDKLNLSIYLNSAQISAFYNSIEKYLSKKRIYFDRFASNLDELIIFLNELGFEHLEIIQIIKDNPSLMHANKNDLLAKYLLLVVLGVSNNGKQIREEILINNPKYYVIGINTLYARLMFLGKKQEYLTKWYLLKMTNKEFENRFGISNEELLALYPYDNSKLYDFLDLPGNEQIKNRIMSQEYKR